MANMRSIKELTTILNGWSLAKATQKDDLRILVEYDMRLSESSDYQADFNHYMNAFDLYIDHAYDGFSGQYFLVMRKCDLHLDPTRNSAIELNEISAAEAADLMKV